MIRKTRNWRILLDVKDQWLGGVDSEFPHPGSAAILLFARWFLLKNLLKEGLDEKYERFIITRSDFVWPILHPSLDFFNDDHIILADGESYGGVSDRYAILSRNHMKSYLGVLDKIVNEFESLSILK